MTIKCRTAFGVAGKRLLKAVAVMTLGGAIAVPASAASLLDAGGPALPRPGVGAAAYFSIPLKTERRVSPQLGFRLAGVRDHRHPSASGGDSVSPGLLDLRLFGEGRPTLFVEGTPVTGPKAAKHKLAESGSLAIGILAAAAVGVLVVYALDDDKNDDEQCLLPEGCP